MGLLSRKQNSNDNNQGSQSNVKKPTATRKPKVDRSKTSGKIVKDY